MIPFIGTSLGSLCVFFVRGELDGRIRRALTGFAAGVMTAASFWSLLLPSLEASADMGRWAFVPAVAGFWLGMGFLLVLDTLTPHLHADRDEPEGVRSGLSKTAMMILAVALHNIPEGMAVGAAYAGSAVSCGISEAGALALSIGIAIQNFPEGAIISLPLAANGVSRRRACLYGVLSGAAEPMAAAVTMAAADLLVPVMPYLLSFAAGAMLYVVVEELIPEMSSGEHHSNVGTVMYGAGFALMIVLDVVLG